MVKAKSAVCLFFAGIFASVVFFSCNVFSDYSIPETVAVKSNARYEVALGQKHYDLSEKLGDDFIKDLEKNAEGDVYKYIPDPSDQTLSYLLHKKVYDVPLDVSDYIDAMDLDDALGDGFSFSKELSLPEVNKSADVPLAAGAPGPFPVDISIDFSMDETIKSATIGSGSISLKAQGSGAVLDLNLFTLIGITKGDGTAYGQGDFAGGDSDGYLINKTLDLSGGKIVIPASEIVATGSVVVSSGTIAEASEIAASLFVETISSATADFSETGKFEMSETSDNKKQVSKEMVAYVKNIEFGEKDGDYYYKRDANGDKTSTEGQGKGISFSAVNSFPAGNDIKLIIKSETFGIDSTDGIYADGESASSATIEGKGNEDAFLKTFAEFDSIDVSDTGKFGTKDDPAYIKFSISLSESQEFVNLRMGESYKIEASETQMLFDWDLAQIDLSNVEPIEDSTDLSDFTIDSMLSEVDGEMSKLIENTEFNSVPVYFLAQKPTGDLADDIGDIALEGTVYFGYTDSSANPQKDYVAGSEGQDADIPICAALDWPSTSDVFSKVFSEKGVDYSFYSDIAPTLNKRPSDLAACYSMKVAGGSLLNLYKARLDSLDPDDKTSIAVEMAAVLRMDLNVVRETVLDIYKIADIDMDDKKDLMKRDSVSDTEDFAKYSGAISYLRLNYNFINAGIDGFNATVTVDDTHEGEQGAAEYSGIVRTLEITGNDSSDDTIDFSSDEVKAALTHFFKPKMTMTVPPEKLTVKRSAIESKEAVGVSPSVVLQLTDSTPIVITDIIK